MTTLCLSDRPGTKVDASYYRETLLQRCLLPYIRQKSDDHFVFQQDGAPSHRAKSTAEFLQRTVPNFIEPSVWPPNSPDLNPVDYAVWGALQQSVYCIPISNLDDLKDRVHDAHLLGVLTNRSSTSPLISGVTD